MCTDFYYFSFYYITTSLFKIVLKDSKEGYVKISE